MWHADRAEVVIDGPDAEFLDSFGTTTVDIDRTNEIVFGAITERRGLGLECRRDDAGLHPGLPSSLISRRWR